MGESSGGTSRDGDFPFLEGPSDLCDLGRDLPDELISAGLFLGLLESCSSSIPRRNGDNNGGTRCFPEVSGFRGVVVLLAEFNVFTPLTVILGEGARWLPFKIPSALRPLEVECGAADFPSLLADLLSCCSLLRGVSGRAPLRNCSGLEGSSGLGRFCGLVPSSVSTGRFLLSDEGVGALVAWYLDKELLDLQKKPLGQHI